MNFYNMRNMGEEKMRVLMVYSNVICACTRKCCFELSEGLKRYCDIDVMYYKELNDETIKKYDVIIFQRLGTAALITQDEKCNIYNLIDRNKNNKKFIYFIDDLILESQGGMPKILTSKCDAAICSSKTLASYLKKYNNNVYIIHTFGDIDFWESIKGSIYNKFTMIWASTGGLGKSIIKGILSKRNELGFEFQLIAIGKGASEFNNIKNVITYPILTEKRMMEIIKGSNILLNPMNNNDETKKIIKTVFTGESIDFLNSKSEIKYAIAGVAKTCLLTSPVENYLKVIKNRENGIIISDNIDDWIKEIKFVYYNSDVVKEITQKAYENVKNNYTIDAVAKSFIHILEEIIKI